MHWLRRKSLEDKIAEKERELSMYATGLQNEYAVMAETLESCRQLSAPDYARSEEAIHRISGLQRSLNKIGSYTKIAGQVSAELQYLKELQEKGKVH